MLRTNVIGIDLAKNVLQACHISRQGELLSNKAVSRQKLKELLAKSKPSLVALEGCLVATTGADTLSLSATKYG
ncbi:hypothetical protein NB577_23595 [Vibrio parahaemolyticus]|nr:hypothetical protein [Vibrio parahaemolyticus]MCR9680711.1 hypothetical protein [Vibrio parahaemolyticus]